MGLLATLDYCQSSEFPPSHAKSSQIEYLLHSWGEIYPQFLGDREHSTAARYILNDYPFKLFTVSRPYSEPPQKLCLTFRAPTERPSEHIVGIFHHEIAKEFAAFLSLVTRRRVFPVGMTRYEGMPIEEEWGIYTQPRVQERQMLKEIDPAEIYQLLENLRTMSRDIAERFVLAMRLYHAAIELMYLEPDFLYILLVTCVESISSLANKEFQPAFERLLQSTFAGWQEVLDRVSEAKLARQIEELLMRGEHFIFQKFAKFIQDYVPERFWQETEDDAKPDYRTIAIDSGGEKLLRSDKTIQPWERIEKSDLKKTLREIYDSRSKLVHEGIPYPPSIVVGHFSRIPTEAGIDLFVASRQAERPSLRIPPLISFERLVSYTLVGFLSQQKTSRNWLSIPAD